MRVTIRRALAKMPKRPTFAGVKQANQYTVVIYSDTARQIAAGISALAKRLREDPAKAYVRLELPHGGVAEARRYGPVRFVSMYVPFPTDGGDPGMRYRLDLGIA